MVGSAIEGEDVLQEAVARAAAFSAGKAIEQPEAWLFRIAHNTAVDVLRRRKREITGQSEAGLDSVADGAAGAETRVAAAASLASLMHLHVAQRSAVVLIDVLGHSLAETAAMNAISVAAVKAALHRGRARLRALASAVGGPAPSLTRAERDRLRAYADRFNDRDFDALRALLAEDVRLDLVNRTRLTGRKEVAVYFTRYGEATDWRFSPGPAEGRPALLVSDPDDAAAAVRYVVLLDWADGRVAAIRDFRYAPYVMERLVVTPS